MTGEPIAKGSLRVGFEIWRMGRRCMTYQKPNHFLSRLAISAAPNGRSKCKFSNLSIKAGDLCVAVTAGGAKGEKPTTQVCILSKLAPLLTEVAKAAETTFRAADVEGFNSLSSEHQQQATSFVG